MDKQKVYCHWDLIRFISEEALEKYCVSVVDVWEKSHFELMIYLYKEGKSPTETYYSENGKPEGVPSELADAVIRCFDMADYYGIDLEKAIIEKAESNKSRPYKHNKEF